MAQLDARPTGDQEVAGSAPAGTATIFSGQEIFSTAIPFADSIWAVVSFWRKHVHNTG